MKKSGNFVSSEEWKPYKDTRVAERRQFTRKSFATFIKIALPR